MKCYIDQSGKVENTSKLTVVAYANGKVRSLKISAVEKLKNLFEKGNLVFPEISFSEITKKSPAHKAAINVYRGKSKPDIIVKAEDILGLFFAKKKGRRSHS